jgi:hypothetical protein
VLFAYVFAFTPMFVDRFINILLIAHSNSSPLRLYTYYNSIEQNSLWEADSRSASQEIPRLLWTSKVHCCFHQNLLLDGMLSQLNPALLDLIATVIFVEEQAYKWWSSSLYKFLQASFAFTFLSKGILNNLFSGTLKFIFFL